MRRRGSAGPGRGAGPRSPREGYPGDRATGVPEGHGVHSLRLGVARTRAPPARRPPVGLTSTITKGRRRIMFDSLSDRLRKTLSGLTGRGRVSEADVDAAMREVRLALLEADVNFKVVKDFVARVRERAARRGGPREPDRRPAGREDRQRGAAPRSCRRATAPSGSSATRRSSCSSACRARARRRRPRSSPGTSSSSAASRCSSPRTRTGPPPPTSSRRSAGASASRSTARPSARRPWTSPAAASRPRSGPGATS